MKGYIPLYKYYFILYFINWLLLVIFFSILYIFLLQWHTISQLIVVISFSRSLIFSIPRSSCYNFYVLYLFSSIPHQPDMTPLMDAARRKNIYRFWVYVREEVEEKEDVRPNLTFSSCILKQTYYFKVQEGKIRLGLTSYSSSSLSYKLNQSHLIGFIYVNFDIN